MSPDRSNSPEDRMDTHNNARLTPRGREQMVRAVVVAGLSKTVAARGFNTTPKTVSKWVERFRAEGVAGLRDRSSRPFSSPNRSRGSNDPCDQASRQNAAPSQATTVDTELQAGARE